MAHQVQLQLVEVDDEEVVGVVTVQETKVAMVVEEEEAEEDGVVAEGVMDVDEVEDEGGAPADSSSPLVHPSLPVMLPSDRNPPHLDCPVVVAHRKNY